MAEPIGLASGVLALATFAFQSSVKLYQLVNSFQSHRQRVRDLVEELNALGGVLNSLTETVNAATDTDFSALKIPLLRCGKACEEFGKEISRLSSRSGGRTSFRDWAKLKYMGEDVDGFRRLLEGYKMTITIALADANLRKSNTTAEGIEMYNELLNTTRANLEDHLEMIDEKLELILGSSVAASDRDTSEVRLIKEERMSTEQCLRICAQLSDHISQIQLAAKHSTDRNESSDPVTIPVKITSEGLNECRDSLARTALKLEEHQKQLFRRLMEKSKAVSSEEEVADLTRLQDEWEATRQSIDICSSAHTHLNENVSIIDNYATGDAVQFMVSTTQKTIHGKNRGLGWRTRQVGGHMNDNSLQQIVRTLATVTIPSSEHADPSPPGDAPSVSADGPGNESDLNFKQQYGRGFKLASEAPGSAEGGAAIESSNKTVA